MFIQQIATLFIATPVIRSYVLNHLQKWNL